MSAIIFGCVHYNFGCSTLVLKLLYCNFFKDVRLGGGGTERLKAPTLGQYVDLISFELGVSRKSLAQSQNKVYTFQN